MVDKSQAEHSLIELAERVEKADGPDRGLDALIAIALDPERQVIVDHEPGRFPRKAIYGPVTKLVPMAEANGEDAADYINAPRYTASLDAAMTLVPEGHNWAVEHSTDGDGAWCYDKNVNNTGPSLAATPALALTAAALRARAAQEKSHV